MAGAQHNGEPSSKKRKGSETDIEHTPIVSSSVNPDTGAGDSTVAELVRSCLQEVAAIPHAPASAIASLSKAYQCLVNATKEPFKPSRVENWNWTLPPETVWGMTPFEQDILKEMRGCKDSFWELGIVVSPKDCMGDNLRYDMTLWEAHLPGPAGTLWAPGVYTLIIDWSTVVSKKELDPDYQMLIPKCKVFTSLLPNYRVSGQVILIVKFTPPLFHVNCYPSGTWSFSDYKGIGMMGTVITKFAERWMEPLEKDPMRMVKVLTGIQQGFDHPNSHDPDQSEAYTIHKNDPEGYCRRIMAQAAMHKPHPVLGLAGRAVA